MTRRYKAFISYSWADRAWGEWLHRTLETYRAPKGVADGQSLHPIFKDREEEAAGGSVGAAIEAALAASEFLIVICSPRSAQSTWVNREVAWFKTHKDKGRILALIVDGEPGASAKPGRESEECFPKTLTHKVGGDLQPTEEWEDAPLAADARAEGDGRRGAKLKLAAALLGVGLDALVRRDERRRTDRRRLVTSAAVGLSAAMSVLAFVAATQRDAAVAAQKEAVKARDDAEGIIELILTDLKSDLEGFGTLKSVTQIGNRAIGYYEGQDVKALTPDQLGRRARVLLMLGEADNKRGDLTAALARYETAAATTQEQLARDPENPQRMFDHAQSVFWVGYIAWQRGDREKAKRQFTEYHDLAQRLVAKDPANEDWQAELDYAYSNLGTLAMDDGEAVAAEGHFRKSLDLALARLAKAPDDVERVRAAGQAYAWLADALHRQVKLNEAQVARLSEIGLYEPFIRQTEISSTILDSTAVAHYRLAQTELARGDLAAASRHSLRAIKLADQLKAAHPEQVTFLERAILARIIFGEVSFHLGQFEAALKSAEEASVLGEGLIRLDGDMVRWSADSGPQIRLLVARTLFAQGNVSAAVDVIDTLIELVTTMIGDEKTLAPTIRIFASAHVLKGRIDTNTSATESALTVVSAFDGGMWPEILTLAADLNLQLGHNAKAKTIIEPLQLAGYRHPDFVGLLKRHPALTSE